MNRADLALLETGEGGLLAGRRGWSVELAAVTLRRVTAPRGAYIAPPARPNHLHKDFTLLPERVRTCLTSPGRCPRSLLSSDQVFLDSQKYLREEYYVKLTVPTNFLFSGYS